MSSSTSIIIYIERLIIDGISIPQRHRPLVQAALEQELARLLTHDGIAISLQSSGTLPYISAGALVMNGNTNPRILGEQIARAVYEGIGQ